jgi:Large ribosomal RNA subunit accumulation protein YceD
MSNRPTNKPASKLPWSVPVVISGIPEGGKRFDLIADEATRTGVAQIAGLRSLPRLQATFDVARHGSDGLRVEGEVSATVGQTCVVTLEPIDNEVKEEVNLVFTPPSAPVAEDDNDDDAAIIDPGEPEPLIGETIDLGALATEFLVVGLDPYPRKPGATFEPPAVEDDSPHPFAALAALKKNLDAKE